jgi:hypothetical protein
LSVNRPRANAAIAAATTAWSPATPARSAARPGPVGQWVPRATPRTHAPTHTYPCRMWLRRGPSRGPWRTRAGPTRTRTARAGARGPCARRLRPAATACPRQPSQTQTTRWPARPGCSAPRLRRGGRWPTGRRPCPYWRGPPCRMLGPCWPASPRSQRPRTRASPPTAAPSGSRLPLNRNTAEQHGR